jgi:hypothetical protein
MNMFWKRIHSDPYTPFARQWLARNLEADSPAAGEEELASPDVRAFLAERFRLVFEFATLGTYDGATSASPLTSQERRQPVDGGADALALPRACAAHRPRSATTGRNVAPTSEACTTRSDHSCGASAAPGGVATRRRPRDGSRRPGAKAPEQPCTWLG